MSHCRSPFRTFVAGVLSASIFLTQSLFAHASERNFWAERGAAARQMRGSTLAESRMADRARELMAGLSAPAPVRPEWMEQEVTRAFVPGSEAGAPSLSGVDVSGVSKVVARVAGHGTLRSLRAPASGAAAPVVVFLQDAHGVVSAQRNISQAILSLALAHPDLVVGMEGAAGPVDASPYRGPSEKVNRQLAEILFKGGLIAGPELAAFAAPAGVRFEGLEDPALYVKNVRAVQDSFPRKAGLLADIQALAGRAEALKGSLWPEALRDFEKRRRDHETGKLPLSDYMGAMPADGPLTAGLTQVSLFRRVHAMEDALDFPAVGRDRAALLSRLSDRLPGEALEELLEAGVSLRAGRLSQTAYYKHFNGIARRAGVSLSDFPRFEKYIAYVTAADQVRPEAFSRELRLLEERLSRSLCAAPAQAELLAAADDLLLAEKLTDFRMTPEDWRAYEGRRDAVGALPARLARLEGASPAEGVLFLADVAEFYRTAEARNEALAGNLFNAWRGDSPAGKVAVVVCGGFHTEGLTEQMVRRGAWVAVVAPNMEVAEITSAQDPLAAFTRAPTPLEKLFEAPKPSLVTEASLARTHLTSHGRAKGGIVSGGTAEGGLILLGRLEENKDEPQPVIDTLREREMMEHLLVDAANGNASTSWTGPDGEVLREEVRAAGSDVSPADRSGFDGPPALSVAGGENGPSLFLGRKASGMGERSIAFIGKSSRRAASWMAAAAFALATITFALPAKSAPLMMSGLPVDNVLRVIGWDDVPSGRILLLFVPVILQLLTLGAYGFSNSIRRRLGEGQWEASNDGTLFSEAGVGTPEEKSWRASLDAIAQGEVTSELLRGMMDSAWHLRARHKVPNGGLVSSGLPEEAVGSARAELERLARVALRSAETCAQAMRVLAARGPAMTVEDKSFFQTLQAGRLYFDTLARSFSAAEYAYGLYEGAFHYTNSYGNKRGSWLERGWGPMRRMQGMQRKINNNLKALPAAERAAKESANVMDHIYADTRSSRVKSITPAIRAETLVMGQKGGNNVRKLAGRYITLIAGMIGAVVPFWGHPVLALFSAFMLAFIFATFQRWIIYLTDIFDGAVRRNYHAKLQRANDMARAATNAAGAMPLLNAQDIRKAMLAVEGEESARALAHELQAAKPHVGVWIMVPRDDAQEKYLKKRIDSDLFRPDVPVIVLDHESGIESGAAFMMGVVELNKRWKDLQSQYPHLKGLRPDQAYASVFFAGSDGVAGMRKIPQHQEPLLEGLHDFRSVMELSIANACRVAQSGKAGGVIFGYLDRASLGHLSAKDPGLSLLTAYESLRNVEEEGHTVVISNVNGGIDRVFTNLNLKHEAFRSYDLENRESRQFEILAGTGLLVFGGRQKHGQVVDLFESLLDYTRNASGLRSLHLTSHLIKPLSYLAEMEGEKPEPVEARLVSYFSSHDTREKHQGDKDLVGFYQGLTNKFLENREASLPLRAPPASGLSTYFRRLPPQKAQIPAGPPAPEASVDEIPQAPVSTRVSLMMEEKGSRLPVRINRISGTAAALVTLVVSGFLYQGFWSWWEHTAPVSRAAPVLAPEARPAAKPSRDQILYNRDDVEPEPGADGSVLDLDADPQQKPVQIGLQPKGVPHAAPASSAAGAHTRPAAPHAPEALTASPVKPAEPNPDAAPKAPAAAPEAPRPAAPAGPSDDDSLEDLRQELERKRKSQDGQKGSHLAPPAEPSAPAKGAFFLSGLLGMLGLGRPKGAKGPRRSLWGRLPFLAGIVAALQALFPGIASAQEAGVVKEAGDAAAAASPGAAQARAEGIGKRARVFRDWSPMIPFLGEKWSLKYSHEWGEKDGKPVETDKLELIGRAMSLPIEKLGGAIPASEAAVSESEAKEKAEEAADRDAAVQALRQAYGAEVRVSHARAAVENAAADLQGVDPAWDGALSAAQRVERLEASLTAVNARLQSDVREIRARVKQASTPETIEAAKQALDAHEKSPSFLEKMALERSLQLERQLAVAALELAKAEADRDRFLGRLDVLTVKPGRWKSGTGIAPKADLSGLKDALSKDAPLGADAAKLALLDAKILTFQKQASAAYWTHAPYFTFPIVIKGDDKTSWTNNIYGWAAVGEKIRFRAHAQARDARAEQEAVEQERDALLEKMQGRWAKADAERQTVLARIAENDARLAEAEKAYAKVSEDFLAGRASAADLGRARESVAAAQAEDARLREESLRLAQVLATVPRDVPAPRAAKGALPARAGALKPAAEYDTPSLTVEAGLGYTLREGDDKRFKNPVWAVNATFTIFSGLDVIGQVMWPGNNQDWTAKQYPGGLPPFFVGAVVSPFELFQVKPVVDTGLSARTRLTLGAREDVDSKLWSGSYFNRDGATPATFTQQVLFKAAKPAEKEVKGAEKRADEAKKDLKKLQEGVKALDAWAAHGEAQALVDGEADLDALEKRGLAGLDAAVKAAGDEASEKARAQAARDAFARQVAGQRDRIAKARAAMAAAADELKGVSATPVSDADLAQAQKTAEAGKDKDPHARLAQAKSEKATAARTLALAKFLDAIGVEVKVKRDNLISGKRSVEGKDREEIGGVATVNVVAISDIVETGLQEGPAQKAAQAALNQAIADAAQTDAETARTDGVKAKAEDNNAVAQAVLRSSKGLGKAERAQAELDAWTAAADLRAAEKKDLAARAKRMARLRAASGALGFLGLLVPLKASAAPLVPVVAKAAFLPFLSVTAWAFGILAAVSVAVVLARRSRQARLARAAAAAINVSGQKRGMGPLEASSAARVARRLLSTEAAGPAGLRAFEDDLKVLRYLQSARPAAAPAGNLDPHLTTLLSIAPEGPAAAFMPTRARPNRVPAVDVSDLGGGVAAFLAQRLRELRDVPRAVLPLVTHAEALSARDIAALKDAVKADLLAGPGEWQAAEVDGLFERLDFGARRLVVTAADMRRAGQDWIDPAVVMDSRLLRSVLRGRAASVLGIPAARLSVSMFTGRADGYTPAAGLEGFNLLQILSVNMVKDVTRALGAALKAFEKAGQSA